MSPSHLIGFGRALALAAAKAPQLDGIVQFAKAAEVAIVVERALHGSFFAQFGITPQLFAETPLSPACHHYVSTCWPRPMLSHKRWCLARFSRSFGFMQR